MTAQIKSWRIIDLINWGQEHFNDKGISNARREIEWFLCEIINCERIDLYIRFEEPLNQSELDQFRYMIKRRLSGEPFQHIIGKASFYGRDFIVNSNVLIPRPETEVIIEKLKQFGKVNSILDIGTGSGCIAITIYLEKLASNIFATDISESALNIANENIKYHKLNDIKIAKHDFLKQKFKSKFDVVVSNPPYININEVETLQNEVKNYDPMLALTDGFDGYSFYKRFAEEFIKLLNPNGFLLLEFGGNIQKEFIKSIFNQKKLKTEFFKDMQNDFRVVKVSND